MAFASDGSFRSQPDQVCLIMFGKLLSHPFTKNVDLDDPATTSLRRRIIRQKRFLRKLYEEWYRDIVEELPVGTKPVLEIGAGAGFLNEFIPGLITSDILSCQGIDVQLSALNLPFAPGSLRAIVMTDALHHIPEVETFFEESIRCLQSGGAIIMIEPWVSRWSKFIYSNFHHEPFLPESSEWKFQSEGAMSSANGALPWIVFERDLSVFEKKFPGLKVRSIQPMMPFRYLLSGGVSLRSLMPGFTYDFWRSVEKRLTMKRWAMFAKIVVVRD